jgi:hypothetical protein
VQWQLRNSNWISDMHLSRITITVALLFLLLVSGGIASNAKAQSCYLCNGTTFSQTSVWMELPSWPGCPIKITYQYRICPGGITELRMVGFDWPDANDPDCAGLLSTIQTSTGSPNWAGIEQVSLEAESTLPQVLFMNAYNAALPLDKASFECPNGKRLYQGVRASCHRWIEIQRWSGTPHFSQLLEWVVRFESCNEVGCCKEEQEICYNTSTHEMEVTVTRSSIEGQECAPLSSPSDPAAVAWSECDTWDCPSDL